MPIDTPSGRWKYTAGETYAGVPVHDVLNRAQDASIAAATSDRARLTTLEQQVGSAYGAEKMSANQTVGPSAATVAFDQTQLAAGVTRTGSSLIPQSDGVYLVVVNFSSTPNASNVFRNVYAERFVAGAWAQIPLAFAQCGMGPGGNGQFAAFSVPAVLAAGDQVRLRTFGSASASSVVIESAATSMALVKVSG